MGRHCLVQQHEASGRETLYIAAHIHHIDGLDPETSKALFDRLFQHATQSCYVLRIGWVQPGYMILWDNTSVMHRAVGLALKRRQVSAGYATGDGARWQCLGVGVE